MSKIILNGNNTPSLNKVLLPLLLVIFLGSLYFFFTQPLWLEPDTTGFYNRSCLNGSDFETPLLSRVIFNLLPCNVIIWKIFTVLISLCSVSALYFFCKKNLFDREWFWIIGLSYFLILFFITLEDDQLAFPIVIAATSILLANNTWKNRIGYGIVGAFVYFFVWKGAIVPITLFLAYSITPLFSPLLPILFIIYHFFVTGKLAFGDPGGSNELILGKGFLVDNIIFFFFFLSKDKKKKISANKNIFALFTSWNIIGFFYPQLSYYGIIPTLLMAEKFLEENVKWFLVLGGMIALVMAPGIIISQNIPNDKTMEITQHAVDLQMDGHAVYNIWAYGRWFHYLGGHPSDEGGYHGEPKIKEKEYYWLGLPRKGCEKIEGYYGYQLQFCSTDLNISK